MEKAGKATSILIKPQMHPQPALNVKILTQEYEALFKLEIGISISYVMQLNRGFPLKHVNTCRHLRLSLKSPKLDFCCPYATCIGSFHD